MTLPSARAVILSFTLVAACGAPPGGEPADPGPDPGAEPVAGRAGTGRPAGGAGGTPTPTAPQGGQGGSSGAGSAPPVSVAGASGGGGTAGSGSGSRADAGVTSDARPGAPPVVPLGARRNAYGNVCKTLVSPPPKDYTVTGLTLSHKHGFHDAPFMLTVQSTLKNIRYTLDGTAPSPTKGTTYGGPIAIGTTSTVRVMAFDGEVQSKVLTRTFIFPKDVQKQANKAPSGAFWDTVVDPRIAQAGDTGAKFVDALKSIPTISITMDPADLFGSGGIHWGANLENRDLEKAGSFEYIDPTNPDGGVQVDAVFKIQGGGGRWSRGNYDPKQSFTVKFKDTVGPGKLQWPVMKTGVDGECAPALFDRIVLRDGHNESFPNPCCTQRQYITLLRDQLARSTQVAMHPDSAGPHGSWAHVYLNGLYWGLYNPTERPGYEGMPYYYGGPKEEWMHYKGKGGKEDHPGNHGVWDMAGAIAEKVRLGTATYAELQKVLDTQQFADWMLIMLGSGVADIQWYATYTVPQPTMAPFSPVRFWVWDAEDSFRDPIYARTIVRAYAGYRFDFDGTHRELKTSLWSKLQGVPEFRREMGDRIHLHLRNDGAMTDAKMLARMRALAKQIELAVIGDLARWGDTQGSSSGVNHNAPLVTYSDWKDKAVKHLEACLTGNSERMFADLKRRGFYPAIDPPALSQRTGDIAGTAMLVLTNPSGKGEIVYTTDGTDPRRLGGELDPKAQRYMAPFEVKEETTVLARVRDGSTWSALAQAKYW